MVLTLTQKIVANLRGGDLLRTVRYVKQLIA